MGMDSKFVDHLEQEAKEKANIEIIKNITREQEKIEGKFVKQFDAYIVELNILMHQIPSDLTDFEQPVEGADFDPEYMVEDNPYAPPRGEGRVKCSGSKIFGFVRSILNPMINTIEQTALECEEHRKYLIIVCDDYRHVPHEKKDEQAKRHEANRKTFKGLQTKLLECPENLEDIGDVEITDDHCLSPQLLRLSSTALHKLMIYILNRLHCEYANYTNLVVYAACPARKIHGDVASVAAALSDDETMFAPGAHVRLSKEGPDPPASFKGSREGEVLAWKWARFLMDYLGIKKALIRSTDNDNVGIAIAQQPHLCKGIFVQLKSRVYKEAVVAKKPKKKKKTASAGDLDLMEDLFAPEDDGWGFPVKPGTYKTQKKGVKRKQAPEPEPSEVELRARESGFRTKRFLDCEALSTFIHGGKDVVTPQGLLTLFTGIMIKSDYCKGINDVGVSTLLKVLDDHIGRLREKTIHSHIRWSASGNCLVYDQDALKKFVSDCVKLRRGVRPNPKEFEPGQPLAEAIRTAIFNVEYWHHLLQDYLVEA